MTPALPSFARRFHRSRNPRWVGVAVVRAVLACAPLCGAVPAWAQGRPVPERVIYRRKYTPDNDKRVREPSKSFLEGIRQDSLRRMVANRAVQPMLSHVGSMVVDIPEYDDEQRLPDGAGGLGPTAYVYASPFLSGFMYLNQVNAQGPEGMLVAVLWIDTPAGTALPASYQALNLAPGINCAYLAHAGMNPVRGWTAFMTQPASGSLCARPSSTTPPLAARRNQGADVAQSDYPGVARFDEDLLGRPTIAFRCLNAWCDIGPLASAPTASRPPSHAGNPYLMSLREGRVPGWHDDQVLSQVDPSGNLVPAIRATVTPVRDLDQIRTADFTNMWVRVATIWLATDPAGTKYGAPSATRPDAWGMRKGLNALEIAYVGGAWLAQVTPALNNGAIDPAATSTPLYVHREQHYDVPVPATARFRWRSNDESVWVDCDQGCCRVDAMR